MEHDYLCTVRVVYRVKANSFEDAKKQLYIEGVKLRKIEAWTVDHVEIDRCKCADCQQIEY